MLLAESTAGSVAYTGLVFLGASVLSLVGVTVWFPFVAQPAEGGHAPVRALADLDDPLHALLPLAAGGPRRGFRRPCDRHVRRRAHPPVTPDRGGNGGWTAAQRRRWLRWWVGATLVVPVVCTTGSIVTFVQAQPLWSGPTRPVTGYVVEEKGTLGITNRLTVTYAIDGRDHEATIPVKGAGFRGPRIEPYFYDRGDAVALGVSRDDPSSVRTAVRWVPAFYNCGVLAASSLAFLGLLIALRPLLQRAIREVEAKEARADEGRER
jgi:hypothetical protein